MKSSLRSSSLAVFVATSLAMPSRAAEAPGTPLQFSGIYPHLAYFNASAECGTGAVVPWADRLWLVTYAPHSPNGSNDKLYEVDNNLKLTIRPESIGGTPANRMIHRESNQLFIGPYAIDAQRNVRAIPYKQMFGRPTGNARHLFDPAGKIYYATMEEGLYEVDVKTLAVTELWADEAQKEGRHSGLPGYHGKGLYSGQGRIVYANNGDHAAAARTNPAVPSGVLAEWDGKADKWNIVRRNQFTEVTGPGGIYGNENPDKDPIWTIGWDHRSLILMVLDNGMWHSFRLPKGSHSYDGAHGWNTEWPRICDIGEQDLMMTMHGTFWRFPKTFTSTTTAGIRPRSNYLKVVGDFTRWNNRLVFGTDDTAQSEFLNKRKAKGKLVGPGQSQSNLWFTDPSVPDQLGSPIGRGAVWMNDNVKEGETSDRYLFSGYDKRGVHLSHQTAMPVTFDFEVDESGRGQWRKLRSVTVPPNGYSWAEFPATESGEWIRVRPNRDAARATVFFNYGSAARHTQPDTTLFNGLVPANQTQSIGGLVRAKGANSGALQMVAMTAQGQQLTDIGHYEMNADMKLRRVEDATAHQWIKDNAAIPEGILSVDEASVLYVDDAGKRWRLPKGNAAFDDITGKGLMRISREVTTERDLFNCHGTFYELPAENAGGFTKVRPVATHNRRITDYCSWRGLLVLSGISGGENNSHIIRSDDGKAAVWVGAVDDLWKFGKAVGQGGPWKDSAVKANTPSDPYLMTAYDVKRLTLSHSASQPVTMRVEVDINGDGHWAPYQSFTLPANGKIEHQFPSAFQAYWVRVVADKDCTATAWLSYE